MRSERCGSAQKVLSEDLLGMSLWLRALLDLELSGVVSTEKRNAGSSPSCAAQVLCVLQGLMLLLPRV